MTNPFYTQICTIESYSESNVDGELVKGYTAVYTSIPCAVYNVGTRIADVGNVRENQSGEIRIMVEGNATNIKPDYRLTLSDPSLGTIGKYLVVNVKPNRFATGGLKSIQLTCKKL